MVKKEHGIEQKCLSEQVELQLDHILTSSNFKGSTQMQNFLRYVVDKKLSGEEKQLKQYTIAVEALGQAESFDADTNPLVRIEAGRLRKKLDSYYLHEGKNDPCIVSIPVGSYAPVFEVNTALSPKEKELVEEKWKHSCGPRLLISCFTDKTQGETGVKLLYFFTDHIARIFSGFLFLRLMSAIPHADKAFSNSVIESYQSNDRTDYILSIYIHQLEGETYELLCSLVKTKEQHIIWSDSYLLTEASLKETQELIGNEIASAVIDLQHGVMHLDWARGMLQRNWDDINDRFKAVVFYRHYADSFTTEAFRPAVQACLNAIEKNADDVVALTIYSEYCRREYIYNHGVIKDPLKEGLKSAQEAVRIKPDSHEAHYVLGQMWFSLGKVELCLFEFEESRRLNKYHALVTFGIGFHLFLLGRWDEGVELVNQSIQDNPRHPDWFLMIPFLDEYRKENYNQALMLAHRIVSPTSFWGPLTRAVAYTELGQTDEAKQEIATLLERIPNFFTSGKIMLERYLHNSELLQRIMTTLKKIGYEFT